MKSLVIAKKEVREILSEKRYLFGFFLPFMVASAAVLLPELIESAPRGVPGTPGFVPIAVVKGENIEEVISFLKRVPDLSVRLTEDVDAAEKLLLERKICGFVTISSANNEGVEVKFVYDPTNVKSGLAAFLIKDALKPLSREMSERMIRKLGGDPSKILNPVRVETLPYFAPPRKEEDFTQFTRELGGGMLIPFLLLIPLFSSISMISDSIVGERERKTLELLLSAPVTRTDIFLGKVLGILAISMSQISLWVALMMIAGFKIHNPLLLLFLFLLVSTMVIGIGVGISSLSKSIREASTYFTFAFSAVFLLLFVPFAIEFFYDSPSLREVVSISPLISAINVATNEKIDIYMYGMSIVLLLTINVLVYLMSLVIFSREKILE